MLINTTTQKLIKTQHSSSVLSLREASQTKTYEPENLPSLASERETEGVSEKGELERETEQGRKGERDERREAERGRRQGGRGERERAGTTASLI